MAVKKFTQADYEALKAAIAQGVLRVKYTDKEIEYRSLNDMLKILDLMEIELGIKDTRGARLFAKHSKGLC